MRWAGLVDDFDGPRFFRLESCPENLSHDRDRQNDADSRRRLQFRHVACCGSRWCLGICSIVNPNHQSGLGFTDETRGSGVTGLGKDGHARR